MKTEEDEAFDDLAKRQGAWGGGFKAKQAMAADRLQEPVSYPKGDVVGPCICGSWPGGTCLKCPLITAQPAQEPFGYFKAEPFGWIDCAETDEGAKALYEAEPKRKWVGLSDDELADIWYKESLDWMEFARAHEAALKEKNFD